MYSNALKTGCRTAMQAWKFKNELGKLRLDLAKANTEFTQHLLKAVSCNCPVKLKLVKNAERILKRSLYTQNYVDYWSP